MSNKTSPKQLSSEFVRSAIHRLYEITNIKSPKAEGEGIEKRGVDIPYGKTRLYCKDF